MAVPTAWAQRGTEFTPFVGGQVNSGLDLSTGPYNRIDAGPHTLIVGMNYYDPFLAAWELGGNGQSLALQSLAAATDFNVLL